MVSGAMVTTIEAMTRLGSADSSSASIPLGAVESEQERIPSIAKAMVAPRIIKRFTVTPMNRATGFSQVATHPAVRQLVITRHHARTVFATGNAVETARIYVRQARRSYRH